MAENAVAMASMVASRNNNLDPFGEEGEDDDSLPEGYVNSLKLNAMIGKKYAFKK